MKFRVTVGALVAVNLLAVGGVVALLDRQSAAALATTCPEVLAEFRADFPRIVTDANNPSVTCIDDLGHGGGGYETAPNHIDINEAFSPTARTAGLTDAGAYHRELIAHEFGHAWAANRDLDGRWLEYAKLRGLTETDITVLREDYAETFARWLGWYECFGGKPYCFANSSGAPAAAQFVKLRAAGMLPAR